MQARRANNYDSSTLPWSPMFALCVCMWSIYVCVCMCCITRCACGVHVKACPLRDRIALLWCERDARLLFLETRRVQAGRHYT